MSRSLAARIALSFLILAAALGIAVSIGGGNPLRLAASIPLSVYIGIVFCLLLNLIAGAARFSFIASQISGAIGLRESLAIVSAGSLGGAFFSLPGQVVARSATMARRRQHSFASAVIVTTYEKVSAAIASALGAFVGGYLVFGYIGIDWNTAAPMVKTGVVGLVAAVLGVALSGLMRSIVPKITIKAASVFALALLCSVAVQIPTMGAYMLAAHSLAPHTPLIALLGASLIVMFAASVPISFAGWGVRELSAVAALGAVGVEPTQAVLAAMIIGAASMLTAGAFAALTVPHHSGGRSATDNNANAHKLGSMLGVAVPVLAAIAVPFQVYLPLSSSAVNVNLADPLAIVGASLFVLRHVSRQQWPKWRHCLTALAFAAATAALTISLLIGFARFGVTGWALMNRYVGWFILLAYVFTGSLAVIERGEDGARIVVQAFIGSVAAVALCEIALVIIGSFHYISNNVLHFPMVGMAQNRNAFAFQLLIALAVGGGFRLYEMRRFAVAMLIIATALVLSLSRSGLMALAALVVTCTWITGNIRILVVAGASLAVGLVVFVAFVDAPLLVQFTFDPRNTSERMTTIMGGLRLFSENPFFGAGLGAFKNQGISSSDGEALVIHSTYVWLLAETGIFGLLAFLLPAVGLAITEMRHTKANVAAATILLCLGVAAIMAGPADMLYQRTFWFMLGASIALPKPSVR